MKCHLPKENKMRWITKLRTKFYQHSCYMKCVVTSKLGTISKKQDLYVCHISFIACIQALDVSIWASCPHDDYYAFHCWALLLEEKSNQAHLNRKLLKELGSRQFLKLLVHNILSINVNSVKGPWWWFSLFLLKLDSFFRARYLAHVMHVVK